MSSSVLQPPPPTTIADFEGRTLTRSANTLTISMPESPTSEPRPARIILRWRFTTPHSATVNGAPLSIKNDPSGTPTAEFDQSAAATITWQ